MMNVPVWGCTGTMVKQMLAGETWFSGSGCDQASSVPGLPIRASHLSRLHCAPATLSWTGSGNSMSLPVKKQRDKGVWESQDGFLITLRNTLGLVLSQDQSGIGFIRVRTDVKKKEKHLRSLSEVCNRNRQELSPQCNIHLLLIKSPAASKLHSVLAVSCR